MPQIAQLAEVWSSQVFWMLLTFGFVFFVVGLGMVPKVQSTVAARDGKIQGDLNAAKAAFEKADVIEADYRAKDTAARNDARSVLAEAKAKAAADAEKRLAKADAKIADDIAAAESRIKAASFAALAEIEAVAAEAAQDMVAKVSGAKASAAAAQKAVKAALAHG